MTARAKYLTRNDTRHASGWALRELRINVRPIEVLGAVADAFDTTREALTKEGRPELSAVLPKQIVAYLARELCGMTSYRELARELHTDHSSIIYGCRKVSHLVATDKRVRHIVARLKSELVAMAEAAQ